MSSKKSDTANWIVVFDLDTVEFKKLYPNKNISEKYEIVKEYLKKNHFDHIQGSGYLSNKKFSSEKLLGIAVKFFIKERDFLKYIKKLAFAEVKAPRLVFNSNEEINNFFEKLIDGSIAKSDVFSKNEKKYRDGMALVDEEIKKREKEGNIKIELLSTQIEESSIEVKKKKGKSL